MSAPDKNTVSSSELTMFLLGSSAALPTTGHSEASKEWSGVRGKSRQSGSSSRSWEQSGKGLNTVEASQLLKQRSLGVVHSKEPTKIARYRKTEGKGGREGVVPNYHLLLNDLSKQRETLAKNNQRKDERSVLLHEKSIESDASHHSCMEKKLEGKKRPRSNSTPSDRTSISSEDDDSSVSIQPLSHRVREDDNDSDDIDARRNRARSKAMQRRVEASIEGSHYRKESNEQIVVQTENYHNHSESSSEEEDDESQTSDSSDADTDSSTSPSSNDESLRNAAIMQPSKPIFIPKSLRFVAAEKRKGEQEAEELEKLKQLKKESEVQKSRTLLATVVASDRLGDNSALMNDTCAGEFTESTGALLPPPDDTDAVEGIMNMGEINHGVKARDEWEVRELLRIIREVEQKMVHLTADDSNFRRPQSETRDFDGKKMAREKNEGKYLQRYFHRGAFYMDEDTLYEAGPDDIRHKAADYARAATGNDLIDKSKLPEVMQVKKFGFARQSTKYKGLKSEDTTDRDMRYLPINKKNSR